jgi:hypothetical protein
VETGTCSEWTRTQKAVLMIQVEIQIATCSKKKSTYSVSAVEGDSMAEVYLVSAGTIQVACPSSCLPVVLFKLLL